MLEFISGPNGEKISSADQNNIRKSLSHNSHSYYINKYYNNSYHFSAPYTYDIDPFLKEINKIIESKVNILQVMGGVHTDSYGHTSGLIGQYNEYNEYFPAIMKDTYIRFKVLIKSQMTLVALNAVNVYHYLIELPHIVKLQESVKCPVALLPVLHELVPTSSYKNTRFISTDQLFRQ